MEGQSNCLCLAKHILHHFLNKSGLKARLVCRRFPDLKGSHRILNSEKVVKFTQQYSRPGKSLENGDIVEAFSRRCIPKKFNSVQFSWREAPQLHPCGAGHKRDLYG